MAALDGELLTKKGIVAAADAVRDDEVAEEGGALAVATINRRLAVLKGTASWAWKHKHWTPENLSPYVVMIDKSKERVRSRQIDQRTIAKLLSKAPHFEAEAFMALGCLRPHARGRGQEPSRKSTSAATASCFPTRRTASRAWCRSSRSSGPT
jgi:hypothetical protein